MESKAQARQLEPQSAGDLARGIGDELKDEGRRLIEDAKTSALEIASDRRDAAAAYVGALAGAARSGASELEQSGYTRSAATITRTSKDVESLANGLSQRSLTSLVADLEGFARERPVLVFSLAFAVAFGATRFLKSAGEDTVSDAAQKAVPSTVDVPDKAEGQTSAAAGT